MDFKFSKDEGKSPQQAASGDKGRQNILLVVLLLLVAGFAYVYLFTGLIRPQEAQKPAEAPAPQVVKKALPPRDGETPRPAAPAPPEAKKETAVAAPTPEKSEPAKVAQAVPTAAAPTAKETPKPKEEPRKTEPAKPAAKAPLPAKAEKKEQKPVVAGAEEKKPAPVGKKAPVAAEKKVAAVAAADKKPAKVKKAAAEDGKAPAGLWTLVVGSYLLEDALATDLVRVRKAGLEAAVRPGTRRKSPMNRLFLAEYGERSTARAELDKLKRHTSDAFIIEQGGKYAVYAGSYLLDARAASEKERLAAAGFTLALKRVEVEIPSKILTAGSFNDKKAAEDALKKLKDAGLKASLSHP
ncbi:MAG: SPOR domain-containing protein [Deltaproteobacteria bacterium]|nr:SPOR domain-containing protein [Deltaproteobacteria bacterium]